MQVHPSWVPSVKDDWFSPPERILREASLLARVAGRSRLGYLSPHDRQLQQSVVVALMNTPPRTVPELTERFLQNL